MATGKRAGKGIKDRNIGDSSGIRPYKLDLTYATAAAFLTAKSTTGENSSSAEAGDIFYNTTTGGVQFYDGTSWRGLASAPGVVTVKETHTYDTFTDGGGAAGTKVMTHSIPAGAVFIAAAVSAITGFTGDTSAALTLGDGSDVDRYNTGTPSVFTTAAAGVAAGAASGTLWHTAAVTPTLTVTSGSDFTSVVAGSVDITLTYIRPY